MSDFLAHNSEYVRRDYILKQDVTTSLDFKGRISVPPATHPQQAVQYAQLAAIKQEVLTQLQDSVQNIQLETIENVTFEFNSMGFQTTSLGNATLYGGLNVIPLKEDGTRLYCVAYSYYVGTKANYPQSQDDYCVVWLGEDYGASSLVANKRLVADPENLSDDDLAYFEQYGGLSNLLAVRVNTFAYISNYNNWDAAFYGFLTTPEKIGASTAPNMGWLSNTSMRTRLTMPYDNALLKKIVALQILPFATSASYATNNIYGVPCLYFKKIWNDKYIDTDVAFPVIDRTHINNRGVYINLPIVKNEQYNNVVYDSTIKDTSNCLFTTPLYKICIKGFWREATKSYEFKQYTKATAMTNVDADWWKD